jgi:flagellar biosynthetic protein FliO
MNSAPDVVSSAFQMLAALGIVLGGLLVIFFIMTRYLKRDGGGSSGQLIRVIASQYIGIKKNIALVEVPGTILVVGVSNDKISLLTKIEDKAIIETIQQEASGSTPSFSDHLQRLTARFKSGHNEG